MRTCPPTPFAAKPEDTGGKVLQACREKERERGREREREGGRGREGEERSRSHKRIWDDLPKQPWNLKHTVG